MSGYSLSCLFCLFLSFRCVAQNFCLNYVGGKMQALQLPLSLGDCIEFLVHLEARYKALVLALSHCGSS